MDDIRLLALVAAHRTFAKEADLRSKLSRLKDMIASLGGIGTTAAIGTGVGLATGNPLLGLGAGALAAPIFGRRTGEAIINKIGT